MGKLNFEETSFEEFKNIISEEIEKSEFENICLSNIICNIFIGFSKNLITNICLNSEIPAELPKLEISENILEKIYSKIK